MNEFNGRKLQQSVINLSHCYFGHNKVQVDEHLSVMFPVKYGLKQGDAILPLLLTLL